MSDMMVSVIRMGVISTPGGSVTRLSLVLAVILLWILEKNSITENKLRHLREQISQ